MAFQEILVVDDSSTSRMIIQRCFQIAGFGNAHFIFAGNGIEALEILQKNHSIDLILTDLNMPKMDGINFILKIRSSHTNFSVPIIVISSVADSAVEQELYNAGVKFIIKKPLSPDKVVKTIGGLI